VSANNEHVAFAVSGSGTYDGKGHIKGLSTTTTTDGKEGSVKPIPYTGVYTVTSDCHVLEVDTDATGAVTHYDEYTGPAGTAVSFVDADDNVVSGGTQTRD